MNNNFPFDPIQRSKDVESLIMQGNKRRVDFDESVMILELKDGDQWPLDLDYVISGADAK